MRPTPDIADVTAFAVEAFELAFASNPATDVFAFSPMATYPYFREVLAELIRVDMELRWRRGGPIRLQDYLNRCPALALHTGLLAGIAFEEYRQRRLAGEPTHPAEYAKQFCIDVSLWPPISPKRSR